jgi:hypothetical protein
MDQDEAKRQYIELVSAFLSWDWFILRPYINKN